MSRQQNTSTHAISVVKLAQRNIGNGKKGVRNASDYLEIWDDSDSITVVNAQKELRHPANGGITTRSSQYQGSKINYEYTKIVETGLKLKSNNLISPLISNT